MISWLVRSNKRVVSNFGVPYFLPTIMPIEGIAVGAYSDFLDQGKCSRIMNERAFEYFQFFFCFVRVNKKLSIFFVDKVIV